MCLYYTNIQKLSKWNILISWSCVKLYLENDSAFSSFLKVKSSVDWDDESNDDWPKEGNGTDGSFPGHTIFLEPIFFNK